MGWLLLTLPLCFEVKAAEPASAAGASPRDRQPVALAFSPDGSRLFVANSRSGSLSVVDPASRRLLAEVDLARGLSDVAVHPDGVHLLALDRPGDALLWLEVAGDAIKVVVSHKVAVDPVSIAVSADGKTAAVASQRSRTLTLLNLGADPASPWSIRKALDLPFSPHKLAMLKDGSRVVAADGFGGKLAVVDARNATLDAVRTIPAHNIRGLAFSPDGQMLAVSHQTIHGRFKADFEDIHWGRLLTNHVRMLRVDALTTPGTDADLLRGSRLTDVGSSSMGAGDPAGLAFDGRGGIALAVAGVDELALSAKASGYWKRIPVGRRPLAVALDPSGKFAYVAETLDDALSVVDTTTGLWLGRISLGARPPLDLVGQGERLFFDAKLSHDGWMSCQTCHAEGQTNGLVVDTLGDGSFGAPKRTPSLIGVGATGPWAWTGSFAKLEDQVRKSVETTMRGRSPSDDKVAALTAYLRSLEPTQPATQVATSDADAITRGRQVFQTQRCNDCHAGSTYTSVGRFDVGLVDEVGNQRFNPPSLRGVGERSPLLHDGRAKGLEEVFTQHKHPADTELSAEEVKNLAAFLKTL